MKRQWLLLRYALPYWRTLLVVVAAMVLGVALEVLRPWPTKLLVDHVLGQSAVPRSLWPILEALPGPEGRDGLLLWAAASTVLLFLGGTLLSMVQSVASVVFGQRVTYALGGDLFQRLQRLSLLFHHRRPVGDTIARVTGDPSCVQTLVTGAILPLLQSVVTLVVMFAIMWRLEPTLTLLSLAVVPFQVLAIRVFGTSMQAEVRRRRDLEGRMMNVVHQSLSAIPAVQAFTREDFEHARFRTLANDAVAAYRRSTLSQLWFKLFVGLVSAIGTAMMMWLGGHYVLDGRMTVGTVLVFLAYLGSLYNPLNAIAYTAATLQTAAANAGRVLEILDLTPDVRDHPDAREVRLRGHVRYEDVSFGYEAGQPPVLRRISFETVPGEVVAIVGPTGAGKTTLVNLLVRFFDPWTGRVTVDGHDLRELRVRSLRQQVALVLQEPLLFPYSVAENIAYGRPGATSAEVEDAAQAASADDFIRRLPDGYATVIGERGATLSGGERQRLSIARAFLKNAPILILDEPTSALDARTEAMLLDALARLMRGRTTFIIAHRLSTVRAAGRILVLDDGRLIEHGRHDELLARAGLYASLYRQQMKLARHDFVPAG